MLPVGLAPTTAGLEDQPSAAELRESKRVTGLAPATPSLEGWRSATELHPQADPIACSLRFRVSTSKPFGPRLRHVHLSATVGRPPRGSCLARQIEQEAARSSD